MKNNLKRLEEKIGIHFNNQTLCENIFIHRSYLNEHKNFRLPSNEKLEFLGDSVLSIITSVYLFKNYPRLEEGDYTEIKSAIVKTESLALAAINLNLGEYIYLSKGEEQGKGRTNKNIMADCFEALIAGIFLDAGFDAAYEFVLKFLFKDRLVEIIASKSYVSSKTKFQEYIQGKYKMLPVYKVISEKGPEHNRIFTIGVYFKNKNLGEGIANSKKEAEEKAAEIAFENRKLI